MKEKDDKTNPETICPSIENSYLLGNTFDRTVFCWARQLVLTEGEFGGPNQKEEVKTVLRLTQSVDVRDILYPAPTCQEMQNYISSRLNEQKDGYFVRPNDFNVQCGIYGYQWVTNPNEMARRVLILRKKIQETGG